jgi:glycosyltransferase involved in cell wall biosynthesis
MKILHLSSNIKFGGSEQQLIHLVEATDKRNIKNYIFCFDTSELNNFKDVTKAVFITHPPKKIYSLEILKKINQIVKEENIDLIHIHNGKFILSFMLSNILFNLKCKAIFSKKDMSRSSSLFSKIKYNYSEIYKTTCVTEAIKKRFEKILFKKNHHKLIVIRDGININELKKNKEITNNFNLPKDKIVVGNIANHVRAKGLKNLILTIDFLVNVKNIKNIYFIQIGRFTDLTEELNNMIIEKNLTNYIELKGFIQNGHEFLPQFDYFMMTSESEGMPLTILESLYYEIPVITTNVGGIPEVIIHKHNGLLSNSNDFESLANNLIELINDSSLRKKIKENGYELIVNKFDSNIMAEQTIEVYKEAILKQ